jgi:hypothetical protein
MLMASAPPSKDIHLLANGIKKEDPKSVYKKPTL